MGEYGITFSGRFNYNDGGGVALHCHEDDYQIQLVYGGIAKAKVDSKPLFVKEGDILFLRRGCLHEFVVISGEGLKTLEIKFSNPGKDVERIVSSIPTLLRDKENIISSLFSQIVEEGYKKRLDYKLMSTTLLTESLIQMRRICSENAKEEYKPLLPSAVSLKSNSRLLQLVTDFVYKNIGERFSLAGLAQSCGFNQDYIYRTVLKETGMSTLQYVNSIKYEQAKSLIQYTDLPLSEISWKLGFSSLQYFSRFFKKRANMSPREYLARTRNRIRTDY